METSLPAIMAEVQKVSQVDLSVYEQHFLNKIIMKRSEAVGAADPSDYLEHVTAYADEIHTLVSSLQVGYTQFFREPLTYGYLEQTLLPHLLRDKPHGSEIRIWSAGCSTGQEPYSIAMITQGLLDESGGSMRFRILGTDVSVDALDQAKAGIYSKSAIQNVRIRDLETYFTKRGSEYEICSKIRQNCQFSTYDLLDTSTANPPDSIYGNFDIIFCSNVLIYYATDFQYRIIDKLARALSPGGYLITSESEKALVNSTSNLTRVMAPTTLFKHRQKESLQ